MKMVPHGYHAHVYAPDASDRQTLVAVREAASRLEGVRVGSLHPQPIGPHRFPMFQLAFEPPALDRVLPWLMAHRCGLPVLIHPLVGDPLLEHRDHAIWLGSPLPLDLAVFGAPTEARSYGRHA